MASVVNAPDCPPTQLLARVAALRTHFKEKEGAAVDGVSLGAWYCLPVARRRSAGDFGLEPGQAGGGRQTPRVQVWRVGICAGKKPGMVWAVGRPGL